MIRIPYGRHTLDNNDIAAVVEQLRRGPLTQGPIVAEFEALVANYVGAKYAVAVSSGTAALHMAYLALGVSAGDKVVTSPNTFVATANAAAYCGAEPIFVDIDKQSLNIDVNHLRDSCRIQSSIKVIAPVHFAGLPCDMPAIKQIADDVGAKVVEDAAHALGATYLDGSRVGNCAFSDITVFSFHPVKMIAAGEGGMLTTNDESVYRELLRLRSHGINKAGDEFLQPEAAFTDGKQNPWYYEMLELGFNYRITDIQCSLAISQFTRLENFLQRRRQLAAQYDEVFANMDHIVLPQVHGRLQSAHHIFVMQIDFAAIGCSRQQLMSALFEKGIGTQVHYIPVFMQPYYRQRFPQNSSFPVVEEYYQQALTIPLYFDLSDEQQQEVIDELSHFLSSV